MSGERISSETNDPVRRLKPRMVDSDWLVMRGMAREIRQLAAELGAPGAVVIDYGCGNMPYRPLFEAAGCKYLGADFDGAPDIAIAPDGRIDAADASADVVVSFQVLEHVRDLGRYFAEARRVLKPDGRLLLSTHGTWLYHPHPEDHRRWTRQGLVAEIEGFGFTVSACDAGGRAAGLDHGAAAHRLLLCAEAHPRRRPAGGRRIGRPDERPRLRRGRPYAGRHHQG